MTGLHISVSQVKEYLRCPRQYELHRVRGVPAAFVPVALAFGSAFHSALSTYYGFLKEVGAPPSLDELVGVFKDAWRNSADGPIPLQAEEDDAGVDHEAKGAAMLAAFYEEAAKATGKPELIEHPFVVELADPDTGEVLEERLSGVFDLVVREGDKAVVVEHKTSARRYSEDQLKYDIQPTAYKLAARQLGLGEAGLRFQVVTKTKVPAMQVVDITRTEGDEADFLRTAVGVLRAIDARAFYPVRGWPCRGCPYSHACTGSGK